MAACRSAREWKTQCLSQRLVTSNLTCPATVARHTDKKRHMLLTVVEEATEAIPF